MKWGCSWPRRIERRLPLAPALSSQQSPPAACAVPAAWGTFIQGTGKTWGRSNLKTTIKFYKLLESSKKGLNMEQRFAIWSMLILNYKSNQNWSSSLFVIFGRNSADIYTLSPVTSGTSAHRSRSQETWPDIPDQERAGQEARGGWALSSCRRDSLLYYITKYQ